MKRRVAITGVGAVTSYGTGLAPLLDSIFSGKSGVTRIERFDISEYPVQIGAQINGFTPADFMHPKDARRYDLYIPVSVASAKMAVEHSGLEITEGNRDRTGVYFGSGIGGIRTILSQSKILLERGPGRVSPLFIPNSITNSGSAVIAMELGITGSNFCIVSACSTSNHTIGEGFRAVRDGYLDVCIAGGAETAINPLGLSGFCVMKAISPSWNDEPHRASRPFDAKRDGFVMGEGGGALVLEAYDDAVARGARIFGEIVGYGSTCDAYHITAPAPGGAGAAKAMELALADGGLEPTDIGYINAHGTSTELNDKNETEGIKRVFGEYAYKLKVSSSKSMHAHLLGAAGVVEGIVTMAGLSRQVVPPTINYENPDPDCDLDYTPNEPVRHEFDYAVNNSFGFGGHNAVLIFKRGEHELA
jgi:3-oxoacyl-[acyl-carrier-protein] synthase II